MSSEGHVRVMISRQKLPQELILTMQGLNDTNLPRENGLAPNEFIDFSHDKCGPENYQNVIQLKCCQLVVWGLRITLQALEVKLYQSLENQKWYFCVDNRWAQCQ